MILMTLPSVVTATVGHDSHLPRAERRIDTVGMPLVKRRFTVDEYHRMAQAGVFRADDRVELLDGQIVEMTPIGPEHAASVDALTRLFSRIAGESAIVRVQGPVILGERLEPQPDLVLLRPRGAAYWKAHPGPADVLLVIEVADTSLDSARAVKLPLYAAAGIPEAWLVDLVHDAIEVYQEPAHDGYRHVRSVRRGQTVGVLHLSGATFSADEVLGPRP